MAKLYLGSREITPIVKKESQPTKFLWYELNNGVLSGGIGRYVSYTFTGHEFDGITEIGQYAFYLAFNNAQNVDGFVNFSSLKTVGLYALGNCFTNSSINDIDLSSLEDVSAYGLYHTFQFCYDIIKENLDLSSLKTIGNYGMEDAFGEDDGLSGKLDLSSLTTVGDYGLRWAFYYSEFSSVDFKSLTSLGQQALSGAFDECDYLKNIYFNSLKTTSFGSYTNQFNNMISDCNGVTLHFPSNMQSTISGLTGYPLFGGTNTTLAFDLPATS